MEDEKNIEINKENEKNVEISKEDIMVLESIYIDLYADYKVRCVSAEILKIKDLNIDKLKKQIDVLEKILF